MVAAVACDAEERKLDRPRPTRGALDLEASLERDQVGAGIDGELDFVVLDLPSSDVFAPGKVRCDQRDRDWLANGKLVEFHDAMEIHGRLQLRAQPEIADGVAAAM